jgi:uncharacterized protein YegP (UPF0339 family)
MAKPGFEIYKDKAGAWRWRLRARNNQLLASGGQAFASKSNVVRSLKSVRKAVTKAKVRTVLVEQEEGNT